MSMARLTVLLLILMLADVVQAETINCTPITSVPATITAQGIYCLTGNLSTSQTSGNAITINANNVTLDFNGWKVGGQAAGTSTQTNGIFSSANNVTIKNGIVRGFYVGIDLNGSGEVVRDMLVDQNTAIGIYITGLGALVEHNRLVDTGGSTASDSTWGIAVAGSGSTVSDNVVSDVTATDAGVAYGIYVTGSNSTARGNTVSNDALPTGGGSSVGIEAFQSIVLNNTMSTFIYGIYSSGGIYAYNTANNCTTNYSGGTAGLGNSGT
jgi:hypothetical protein